MLTPRASCFLRCPDSCMISPPRPRVEPHLIRPVDPLVADPAGELLLAMPRLVQDFPHAPQPPFLERLPHFQRVALDAVKGLDHPRLVVGRRLALLGENRRRIA